MTDQKRFLLVAGNIGAGKTSLTRRLAERLEWQSGYESVGKNPYLADFYGDMQKWSFHLQVFLLGNRARQHQALALSQRSAISDRSIYEDAHIFARALLELGNLAQRDHDAYRSVFELVTDGLYRPDLLIFLKAPVDTLMDRIQRRGRAMEKGITPDYLGLLDRYYDEWIAAFDICPVLTIDSDAYNFVDSETDLTSVIGKIKAELVAWEPAGPKDTQ